MSNQSDQPRPLRPPFHPVSTTNDGYDVRIECSVLKRGARPCCHCHHHCPPATTPATTRRRTTNVSCAVVRLCCCECPLFALQYHRVDARQKSIGSIWMLSMVNCKTISIATIVSTTTTKTSVKRKYFWWFYCSCLLCAFVFLKS